MGELSIARFPAAFRWSFKHASATRRVAENVLVCIGEPGTADCGYGEACPRSYVTGETTDSVAAFVAQHGRAFCDDVRSVDDLRAWIAAHERLIDGNPAAFGALEMAMLDRQGRSTGQDLETLLGIDGGGRPAQYSAVLGDAGWPVFAGQAVAYRLMGLTDVKIKLNAGSARPKVAFLKGLFGSRLRLRGDGNNLWPDAGSATAALRDVQTDIWALEEPVAAGDLVGCRAVSDALDVKVILDESLTTQAQLAPVANDAARWIANVRVSKMGGIIRSVALARAAAAQGVGVIVGAHVGETSLLARAALVVAASLPAAPVAMEGAFGTHLLREDVANAPIMFGRGGRLDAASWIGAGSGLAMNPALSARFAPVL